MSPVLISEQFFQNYLESPTTQPRRILTRLTLQTHRKAARQAMKGGAHLWVTEAHRSSMARELSMRTDKFNTFWVTVHGVDELHFGRFVFAYNLFRLYNLIIYYFDVYFNLFLIKDSLLLSLYIKLFINIIGLSTSIQRILLFLHVYEI
jgi:hypothetical protein